MTSQRCIFFVLTVYSQLHASVQSCIEMAEAVRDYILYNYVYYIYITFLRAPE